MARGVSAEERAGAVSVIPAGFDDVDDVENAFNDLRENLQQSQSPGEIRAFELPIDERGMIQTTKAQVRLDAWPIDAYTFNELCSMLVRDYMDEGASKMAVRLMASRPGQSGTAFNKVVVLKRPRNKPNATGEGGKESTASIIKAVQDMNDRLVSQVRSMIPERRETDAATEIQRMLTFSQAINAPMMTMLGQLLPAIAGRAPAALPDPVASLSGIVDVAAKLADMKGGEGGGGEDDESVMGVIKAVAGAAKPFFEALPTIAAAMPRQRPPIPGTARVIPPGMAPTPPGAPAQPASETRPPQGPARPPHPADLASIPSGDAQVFATLKPHIDTLVTMAESGADPVPAADLLFDTVLVDLNDFMYDKVCSVIEQPNFLSNVAAINPKAAQHKEYFEKFRAQVLARIKTMDAEAGQEPTPTA